MVFCNIYILFNFVDCECNLAGSYGNTCDANGKCNCKANIVGNKCDTCSVGYWNFPACEGKNYLYIVLKFHYINEIIPIPFLMRK